MTDPVRVVIADDHPMYRYGVPAVLAAAPEVEVVGGAATGQELLALVERETPDVVLTDLVMPDLVMPDLDGAAATAALLSEHPELPVLVLTLLLKLQVPDRTAAAVRARDAGLGTDRGSSA